jgi:hypothetical protein
VDPLPRILLHGTTAHLAEAIKAHGLQPRDGRGPFLCGDPERARGYAARASCLALAEADPDCDLANLPAALLVVVTVPATALLADPAHAGDYWLTDPSAATLRLETFDPAPWIDGPEDAQRFAKLMQRARDLEDQYGSARRGAAERLPDEEEAAPTRTTPSRARERAHIGNGPPTIARVEAAPPSTGTPLG